MFFTRFYELSLSVGLPGKNKSMKFKLHRFNSKTSSKVVHLAYRLIWFDACEVTSLDNGISERALVQLASQHYACLAADVVWLKYEFWVPSMQDRFARITDLKLTIVEKNIAATRSNRRHLFSQKLQQQKRVKRHLWEKRLSEIVAKHTSILSFKKTRISIR